MNNHTTPLPLSKKLAAMGIEIDSLFYWVLPDQRGSSKTVEYEVWQKQEWTIETLECPAYLLHEIPNVLQEAGKIKRWKGTGVYLCKTDGSKEREIERWEMEWMEICKLFSEKPESAWSYLEKLIK